MSFIDEVFQWWIGERLRAVFPHSPRYPMWRASRISARAGESFRYAA